MPTSVYDAGAIYIRDDPYDETNPAHTVSGIDLLKDRKIILPIHGPDG
jgi:hypothetical protein